ncbi:MAG TPA: hypothetical protein VFQ00_10780 [Terriglobales bacterium]|nr:hypothetical protein [Terriglobales bacterium]
MQRVNEFSFYELAGYVHPLTQLSGKTVLYSEIWYEWFQARSYLDGLFSQRPLSICLPSANKLYAAITAVVPEQFEDALKNVPETADISIPPSIEKPISNHRLYSISKAASEFETVLSAEVQALDTYFVSQKGSYKTSDLIERAEIMFPESLRVDLPSSAVEDIRQAGRCLALDTPTGAGFHILRAMESVMAAYYNKVLGKPMPTRMRNWGIYIRKLQDSGKADPKVTEFLLHIKDNYRNPITHPDVILTSDEVEVLLGAATSAIRQMVLEIQRLAAESVVEASASVSAA